MIEVDDVLRVTRKCEITEIAETTFKKNEVVELTLPDSKTCNKVPTINVGTTDFLQDAQETQWTKGSLYNKWYK